MKEFRPLTYDFRNLAEESLYKRKSKPRSSLGFFEKSSFISIFRFKALIVQIIVAAVSIVLNF